MRRVLLLASWPALVVLACCGVAGAAGQTSGLSVHKNAYEAGENTDKRTASVDFREGAAADQRELAEDLRRGGYVVLVRYAEGRHQRSLSSENRTHAIEVGDLLCELGAPVGRVVASPGVQARGAAEAAFGRDRAKIERSLVWSSGVPQADDLDPALRELLSEPPPEGENVVLAASVVDAADVADDEATVLKPLGRGNFQRVGTFQPERSTGLVRSLT